MTTTPPADVPRRDDPRRRAAEFPLMIVVSIIYPCNFGCPLCPYTDENSELRRFYRERGGDFLPVELWRRMADEAGEYGSFLRCTGGGEPLMHPHMVEMAEYARQRGARLWINTNGSMFGPDAQGRARLERILRCGTDLIEFSMDAGDAETYARLRPPLRGRPKDPARWFEDHVGNVRAAVRRRTELRSGTRVVVSLIRQESIRDRIDEYVRFYMEDVGVDEVITRKFLSWDDNSRVGLDHSLDEHLYRDLPAGKKEPCVWPFERLNVDTLGRVALCGQDISFRTSGLFPNLHESSIKDVWRSEKFDWYRRMHLDGRGAECFPCRGCSAWLAGIRDWDHGWLKVLRTSGDHLEEVMSRDLGAAVDVHGPGAAPDRSGRA